MQIQLKTSTALTNPNGDSNLNNEGSQDDVPIPGQDLPKDDDKINVRDLQHGPYDESKRQCKDLFWFFFYWLNTLAMIILSAWAYFTGAPSNIYRATDSYDNVCGKRDTPVENYRYVYFYNLATYDTSKRVCLEFCPRLDNGGYNFQCYPNGPACVPNLSVNQNGIANQTIQDNGQYFIAYESAQKIDRICLPSHNTLNNALLPYSEILASGLIQSKLLDIVSDVQNDYGWLFIMGGIAIVISIVYWIGLRLMPVVSIWVSLIMTIVLFCLIAFVFLYNGGALTGTDVQGRLGIATGQDRAFYTIYGGFCMAFTIITIIVFICCFHQLGPTIQMLKIANKFFSQIPTSLIIVGMMTAMMYLFWMTAISSMIYAVSASQYNPTGKVFTQVTGKSDRGIIMFYYFLFNGFWTHQIFMSTMVFAISNITAKWYFHTGPINQLDKPMWRTLMMIMRYLFGSLAFGSLILLLVQFLQFFIEMIFFVHSWKYHDHNPCFRAIDDCLQAFAMLMSKATKRINRFAYIQIALRGKSFIEASKDGYRLLKVNEHRYGFLFTVDSILFFMIRLGVALIPTTIFYLFVSFASFTQTNIMQPIYFVLLIFYFSLGMASVIIGSYSACIDTLMTCYVIDQLNQKEKDAKPLYAPVEMVELFRFIR